MEGVDIAPGKVINNRFKILAELGKGATSSVYAAQDLKLNRKVALKIIPKKDTLEERVKREIQITANLNHPNIVTLYDFLTSSNFYLAIMELVEGVSLRKMLEKRRKLPWDKALYIAIQLLSALEEAHKKSIVHKDIKPENILITREGKVKLTDFGISSLISREKRQAISGTIGYMSPEQITGKYVDETTDIYALGVVLYEMLTGKNPFVAEDLKEAVHRSLNLIPDSPSSIEPTVPKELDSIVLKAMAKDPDFRFQSAAAFKKALLDFQASKLTIKTPAEKETEKPQEQVPVKKRVNFQLFFLKFLYLATFFWLVYFISPISKAFDGLFGYFLSTALFVLGLMHPQAANLVASLAIPAVLMSVNLQFGLLLLLSLLAYNLFNFEYRRSLAAPYPFIEALTAKIGLFPLSAFLLSAFADGVTSFTGAIASAFVALFVKLSLNLQNFYFFTSFKNEKMPDNVGELSKLISSNSSLVVEILIFALSTFIASSVRSSISGKKFASVIAIFTFYALLTLGYQIHFSIFKTQIGGSKVFLASLPAFLLAVVLTVIYEGLKLWYEKNS